jgi:hypothetical protein
LSSGLIELYCCGQNFSAQLDQANTASFTQSIGQLTSQLYSAKPSTHNSYIDMQEA